MAKAKVCLRCDQKIDPERLEFLPNTPYCKSCAELFASQVVHDPNQLCAKASVSCQNGFSKDD